MKHLSVLSFGLAVTISLLGWVGCAAGGSSGGPSGDDTTQTGGSTSTAGDSGSGGSTSTAGASGSAGSTATAGAAGSAGSNSTAGAAGSAGNSTAGAAGSAGNSTAGASGNAGSNSTAGSSGTAGASGGAAGTGGTAGASGGAAGTGGTAGGSAGSGGTAGGTAGTGGGPVDCSSSAAAITFPTLPGAVKSPVYTVTANGTSQFVEKLTKFGAEMQVHYAHFGLASGCTATISVTLNQSFSSYTLSPKSRNIAVTKNGNTLTFTSGPNYLILQGAGAELLFILIDDQEANPPKLGDANVKNLADYSVDNTGATLVTSKIQSAINAASGATQNILYVPPGRYKTGELALKSNMTLYLAGGSILDGSTNTGDYSLTGTPAVESTSHGVVHLNNVTNANILGRGVIDGEGTTINAGSNDTPAFKINVLRVDQSSKILIDGIVVRDPVFWNTLVYKSDQVTIQNYKVINRRPTTTTYNQTDGIDYDASTNGNIINTFVYSGDDNLSPKTEQEGGIDTKNITYQNAVLYSNSGGCKIGTKTFGTTMDGIMFKDIDIVKAGRAIAIDANDTAVIQNAIFQNIRVEAADSNIIDIEEDMAPTWRVAPNTSTVKNVTFTNLTSDVKKLINIHGLSATINVNGVHFTGLKVQGNAVTSQTDTDATWNINQFVSNITFQ